MSLSYVIPNDACVGMVAPGTLRGSTERTHRLASDAASRTYLPFAEVQRLHQEAPVSDEPFVMLNEAIKFAYVFTHLTPLIRDDELIVGGYHRSDEGQGWNWFPDGFANQVEGYANNTPDGRADLRAMAERGLYSPQGSLNHKVVGYAEFIRTGSEAIIRRAQTLATERDGEAKAVAEAFILGHQAMIEHARRYADACEQLAETALPARADELREIARICRKVPAQPAETFHEAMQSLWFAYMTAGDGTGRPDVYLNDFYQADLAARRITPERALELIECLLIKLHGDYTSGVINVSSIQTMTLAGQHADGSDASNALTRLFMQAARNIRLLRPSIYVRTHAGTPDDVLELAVTLLGEGLSEPEIFGDEPVLKGLTRLGVPLEVARDYALSGCAEVVSPGLGNWGAPNGWINMARLVDEALRDFAASGRNDADGLWETLARHIDVVADACRDNTQWVDEQRADAAMSSTIMMPVCLENGRDLVHGGAATHYAHWEGIGLPNAADMLYSADQLALRTGRQLADVFARLDADDSDIQAQIDALPKFGNDAEGPDGMAAKLVTLLADALERRSTPLRKAMMLGHLAGGENMHICYGRLMGATLDGRTPGQPLADSMVGSQGKNTHGPTAVIRSLCRLDHSRLVAGNVSTVRLSPADFATAESRRRVVALIRAFIALGGSQLQFNVIDGATLRKAQASPRDYRGLLVRVAGYSSDFTCMGRDLQNEIIARTEGLN